MGEKRGSIGGWPAIAWTLVCVAWLVVVWTWSALHLAMTVDDTYYYFKTALNVSRGIGSSFDGINPTDGYHPLWLALLSVVFRLCGDDMVMLTRVAFTLQIAMIWAGGMLLARLRLVGGTRVLWPLALVLANPFAAKIVLCGQETALQFLLSSAAISVWWSQREAPHYRPRAWAGLAVICALTALSRLDSAFFCVVLLAMPLVLPGEQERRRGLAGRLNTTVFGLAVFGCGLGAFVVWHLQAFHHLMPVSGAIKQHLDDTEVAPRAARFASVAFAVAGMAYYWAAARRRDSRVLALLGPPIAATAVFAIYNFGVRGEMSPSLIRIWYLEPFLLAGVMVIGAILASGWRARAVVIAFAISGAVWLAASAAAWMYRLAPRSYNLYQAAERCSRWADEHPEVGTIGAAWDAGFAGAFTRKSVMNLDGLISSWEYKQHYLDLGKVDEFITQRHQVDFVIQYAWPGTIDAIARRFEHEPVPGAPRLQTTVTGSHDPRYLSSRWGVDLTPFHVAHVECVPVSVAYNPGATIGAVFYFVLSRAPLPGRPTFADFARTHQHRDSCEGFAL